MKRSSLITIYCLLTTIYYSHAQSSINRFLTPSDTFNKPRTILLATSGAAMYAGTIIALDKTWYSDYSKTSFHFFNDAAEWHQMDKAGHIYTSYFESVWSTEALEWAGLEKKKAAWIGGITGFVLQSTLEVLDGFSEKWGASTGDLAANAAGSALCITQQLLWDEQRLRIKFSFHPVKYPGDVATRVQNLFGNSMVEKTLKDYNGQTYWLSVNPASFIKNSNSRFPQWLCFSIGYGASGMLGGYDNTWAENGEVIDRSEIQRLRQFYLSADVDLTRIKTKSQLLKTVFSIVNIIKIPAPAIEINSNGQVKAYPLYF